MSYQRFLSVVVTVVALGSLTAGPAAAAECGSVDQKSKRPLRASLTLDEDSVASIAYGRHTSDRTLLLRFRATGCDLIAGELGAEVDVLPKQGLAELPSHAVSLVRARRDTAEFSARLAVDPDKFDPGTYGGFIELRAPDVATTRTPISISRSEDNPTWPLVIGAIGGLAGLVWFWLMTMAEGALMKKVGLLHYVGVFVAAAVAGIISVASQYLDQEVWSLDDNGLTALTAAFTGATTGAMVTVIGVLWKNPASSSETPTRKRPRSKASAADTGTAKKGNSPETGAGKPAGRKGRFTPADQPGSTARKAQTPKTGPPEGDV